LPVLNYVESMANIRVLLVWYLYICYALCSWKALSTI